MQLSVWDFITLDLLEIDGSTACNERRLWPKHGVRNRAEIDEIGGAAAGTCDFGPKSFRL